jgi:hypothetical protein
MLPAAKIFLNKYILKIAILALRRLRQEDLEFHVSLELS